MRTDPDRFEELADQYNTHAECCRHAGFRPERNDKRSCSNTRVPRAIGGDKRWL